MLTELSAQKEPRLKFEESKKALIVDVGNQTLFDYWHAKREWASRANVQLHLAWNNPLTPPCGPVQFCLPFDNEPIFSNQRARLLSLSAEMRSLFTRLSAITNLSEAETKVQHILAANGACLNFLPNEGPSHGRFGKTSVGKIGIPAVRYWNTTAKLFSSQWQLGSILSIVHSLEIFSASVDPDSSQILEKLRDLSASPFMTPGALLAGFPDYFEVCPELVSDVAVGATDTEAMFFCMTDWNPKISAFSTMRSDHDACLNGDHVWETSRHPMKVSSSEIELKEQVGDLESCNASLTPLIPLVGPISDVIRSIIAEAEIDDRQESMPEARLSTLPSTLVHWLNEPVADYDWLSRFWRTLLRYRPDVIEAFPELESWDRQAFVDWAIETLQVENSSPLIARPARSALGMRWTPLASRETPVDVQVVGYLRRESSLGDVARRLLAEVAPLIQHSGMLAYDRTMSPRLEWTPDRDGEWLKAETGETVDTSIIVVNSDQLGYLLADLPMVLREAKSLIGYWYWELETPPRDSDLFDEILDEIWVGSTFVQKSVESGASIPVRYVPLPVGQPATSALTREDLGLPTEAFVFTTTFDFYSVGERKNPDGTIEAFKEAFPTPASGIALVIKTMHAKERREEMVKLEALTEGRPDIVFIDGVLNREDQHRLLELSDCLVSLHRSEGFGLHLAEAMHLGTPVIATGYSANLDFMDDDSALLVSYTLSNPSDSQSVYPTDSEWAEPDITHAARQMRRLYEDSDLHQRMSRAGKARIEAFDEMARSTLRAEIARRAIRRTNSLL